MAETHKVMNCPCGAKVDFYGNVPEKYKCFKCGKVNLLKDVETKKRGRKKKEND